MLIDYKILDILF